MINSTTLLEAMEDIVQEKGISKDIIIEGIKEGFQKAYEKFFDTEAKIVIDLNDKTGVLKIFQELLVVEEIEDDWLEIELESARKISGNTIQIGDTIHKPIALDEEFSRLAVYQVRQILQQKIKNAERGKIYDKFIDKEKQILRAKITGMNENKSSYLIDIDGVQISLWNKKIIPKEKFNIDEYISVYVEEVSKETRFSQITVSRTHPNFLSKLLEQQVPEIKDKIVEIKGVSRDPGQRAKVAVVSHDPNIDPIGTVVGLRGTRINPVSAELKNEKIDVILWDENIEKFIMNSMLPVSVISINMNEEDKECDIVVPNQQFSLAIGRKGSTARLVANLVQTRINIFSYDKALENDIPILWNGNITKEKLESPEFENAINNRKKSYVGSENKTIKTKTTLENWKKSDEIDVDALKQVQEEIEQANKENDQLDNDNEKEYATRENELEEIQKNIKEIDENLDSDDQTKDDDNEEFDKYDEYYDE